MHHGNRDEHDEEADGRLGGKPAADGKKDKKDENKDKQAAAHDSGQDQEPKQAEEDSSSTWDTDEHSDALRGAGRYSLWPGALMVALECTPRPK